MLIKKKLDLKKVLEARNVVDLLSEEDRTTIGLEGLAGFKADVASRSKWEANVDRYMDLAMQVVKKKSYPWPKASNAKYPLLSTAALQYSSRAYSTLIPDRNIVKCLTYGDDVSGEKTKSARRVSQHMNYQLFEEIDNWEEDMDRLLMVTSIVGCAFKKTYYNQLEEKNASELVLPKNLVVDYYTKSLESAYRISHVIYLSRNYITSMERAGLFYKKKEETEGLENERLEGAGEPYLKKQRDMQLDGESGSGGTGYSERKPDEYIEQHGWLDLDGDGYEEPYIATIDTSDGELKRLEPRFDKSSVFYKKDDPSFAMNNKTEPDLIVRIEPDHYFTKYGFVPSPDGSFYDHGFGQIVGPLNDVINTNLNQLIDSGTLSTLGGGMIARGLKMKGGVFEISPGEWKFVDSTGDDIRKSFVPIPTKEPSAVLLSLMTMLINAGQQLTSVTDPMTGQSAGDRASEGTTAALIDQGLKVFTSIMRRTHRSLKNELKKLYKLNKDYLKPVQYYRIIDGSEDQKNKMIAAQQGQGQDPAQMMGQMPQPEQTGTIERTDYQNDDTDVVPNSNPEAVSESQLVQKLQMIMPFLQDPDVDGYELKREFFKALRLPNVELILPEKDKSQPAPPDPAQLAAMAKLEIDKEKLDIARDNSKAAALAKRVEALKTLATMEAEEEDDTIDSASRRLTEILGVLDEIDGGDPGANAPGNGAGEFQGMAASGGDGSIPQIA
jgi:chaperonin GroES